MSGLGLSATAHPAARPQTVFPLQCSASYLVTPAVPGQFHFRRHTDNKAPEADPCCSAPTGADRTDAVGHGTWQKSAVGPESPYRPLCKQTPARPLFLYPAPTYFQITPDLLANLPRFSVVYDTVVLVVWPPRLQAAARCNKFSTVASRSRATVSAALFP